ncbi:DinB family protein [Oryzobacter telluris]|uniref:DinB family protein n=1 Tax=Oryzobacter telluris TaxID=3149179 RepID=UPI00370D7F82
MLTRIVPTAFYADLSVGLDLFVDGLRMEVVHRDGDLAVVERHGAKLNLVHNAEAAAHAERPEYGLETDDIESVFADVSARRPDLLHPNLSRITLRPWGAREFALLDSTTVCVVVRQWEDARRATFVDTNLRGARFVRSDLSGAVMRGVDVAGADIDAPWLLQGGSELRVNGVDVVPYVEAELNRRFPGRADQAAQDPDGLRQAWAALERTWAATLDRVAAMPPGTPDVSVDGEWSFAQTLRHLVMATDTWLGGAVLEREAPYHPLGQPHAEYETDGHDPSIFVRGTPPYADVLTARADRVALVRGFLATVTREDLAVVRRNPWSPEHPETTLSCLHTILEEEWEHHRYAVRDLDAIEAGSAGGHAR